jgi:hypothetical protein
MNKVLSLIILSGLIGNSPLFADVGPVKMSKSGICHAPGSTYYSQTKNFTPYKTLDDCIRAGGRMPKK